MSLQGLQLGRHFMIFICLYVFLTEVMVKFTKREMGHFVTLIEVGACSWRYHRVT